MPDVTLVLDDLEIDPDRLAAFDRVCGYPLTDSVPACYVHILAFPLQLKLMTDGSFPLAAIGLVHIANKITQHRPVRVGERLSLRVWATELEPHPRGRQFTLRSAGPRRRRARVGGVGDEPAPRRLHGSAKSRVARSAKPAKSRELASTVNLPATATWRLPGDLGRSYGGVSGDRNPIHMHALSARLFGFPTAIAHGMWTKARCLAALDAELEDAYTVEVAFRKPILLPASVKFAEQPADGEIRFGVRDARKDTPHLDGTVNLR